MISAPSFLGSITYDLDVFVRQKTPWSAETVLIPNCTRASLCPVSQFALDPPPIPLLKTIKQSDARNATGSPFVPLTHLELGERLDGLGGAGKHAEDVESDL